MPFPSRRTWIQLIFACGGGAALAMLGACGGAPVAPQSSSNPPPSNQHYALLSWTEATPGTTFNVYRGTASGGESAVPINTGAISSATYQDFDVVAGQIYFYTIQAADANGVSPMSAEISATIPSP
jgi:hypothetical protein